MDNVDWHIYLGEIPYNDKGVFWVSFESDPRMRRTKANIYGKCLPCIQNLYEQLRAGESAIDLGDAFHCWKIAVIVEGLDQCLAVLAEFEKRFPGGHVYGKLGSGLAESATKVVVFHADQVAERDRLEGALRHCLDALNLDAKIEISRACAVLYEVILGDWRTWRPTTPIRFPEKVGAHIEKLKKIMYYSAM